MKWILLLMLAGCSTTGRMEEIRECISDQTELYGDICAESSSGYEDMTPIDAHYDGVECATETALMCLDAY